MEGFLSTLDSITVVGLVSLEKERVHYLSLFLSD